jgi:two-component system response regulator NreC
MEKIRVLLADDHTLFREGVKLLLETTGEVQVVGQAADGNEALELARSLKPDVAIMDITMPELNGLEATRLIRQELPGVQVLILTMHGGDDYFFKSLQAGASGYVLKEAAGMDLQVAIKAVQQGGMFIYPSIAKRLVKDFMERAVGGEERASYETLTIREKDTLALVGEGLTNQEIAERLSLTVNTVQTHRTHIMDKLNFHSRAELMKYAIRLGHLRPSSS